MCNVEGARGLDAGGTSRKFWTRAPRFERIVGDGGVHQPRFSHLLRLVPAVMAAGNYLDAGEIAAPCAGGSQTRSVVRRWQGAWYRYVPSEEDSGPDGI